jgi:uncharacterized protein YkwD
MANVFGFPRRSLCDRAELIDVPFPAHERRSRCFCGGERRLIGALLILVSIMSPIQAEAEGAVQTQGATATPVAERAAQFAAPGDRLLQVPAGLTAYSIGDPTDEEQLYVERINRARANPTAEGKLLAASTDPEVLNSYQQKSVDLVLMASQFALLSPAPPLSISPSLGAAARLHSQDMLNAGFQAHDGSDGSTFVSRAQTQGYFGNMLGENVFAGAVNVEEGHAAFEVDWGGDASTGGMQDPPNHRLDIHNALYREIGVGVVNGRNGNFGPQFVTQDFGTRQESTPFVTGVVYYDVNGNGAYDLGEGIGGVTIQAGGSSFYAVSASAGGFSIPVPQNGNYTVTFSVPGTAEVQTQVLVAGSNVKADHWLSYVPPALSGPAKPVIKRNNPYSFTAVPGASQYEWKRNRLVAGAFIDGAENDLGNVTVTSSPGYSVVDHAVAASGQSSFHLAQPLPEDQILTLNSLFVAGPSSSLSFASRLGWATASQFARVQISADRGGSWQEVWSQAGTGNAGEREFFTRTIPLGSFARQELMVRFVYHFVGDQLFPQTDSGIGFYIDDIALTGISELLDEAITPVSTGTSFTFAPASADAYMLSVRPRISGRAFPWGPIKTVTGEVGQGPLALVHLDSIHQLADGRMQIDFAVVNPGGGEYRVQTAVDPSGPWTPESGASIENNSSGLSFRALIPASAGSLRFYRIAYE